jgi:hypothetical protein
LQEGVGLLGEEVASGGFFADIEEGDAGVRDAHHGSHVYTAEEGKLDQVLGLAVYVSAHVADEGVLIISVGIESAERRAGDAGKVSEFEHGGGHDSTGIACANEGVYLAFFEGLDAYINSRVGFLDDGASGVFVHANNLCSGQDTNLTIKGNAVAGGFRLEALRIAYQNDLYLWCQAGQGEGHPLQGILGDEVSPHRIYPDAHQTSSSGVARTFLPR